MLAGKKTVVYSIPVTNNNPEGESEIYRQPFVKNALIDSPDANLKTLQDVLI
jgi:hypothetical protein